MRKSLILSIIIANALVFSNMKTNATTDGPTGFEFIGLDTVSNSLYFTKFIGKECDCPVELWTYSISDRKFEVNKNWWDKYEYDTNKVEVLARSKMNLLKQLDTINNSNLNIYSINWLEIEKRFDPIVYDTVNYYPYVLEINDTTYSFGQLENKTNPKIRTYLLENSHFGFLIITPHGRLGVVDKIIFFEYPETITEPTLIENEENSEYEDRDTGIIVSIIGMWIVVMFMIIRRRKKKNKIL